MKFIIVDFGTYLTRLCLEDEVDQLRTVLGKVRNLGAIMVGVDLNSILYRTGIPAIMMSNYRKLIFYENGLINNEDHLVRYLKRLIERGKEEFIFLKDMKPPRVSDYSEYSIIFSTSPNIEFEDESRQTLSRLSSKIYETFEGLGGLYFESSPSLSLFSTSRSSGCVVDVGFLTSHSIVILDGKLQQDTYFFNGVNGYDIFRYFCYIASQKTEYMFTSSDEVELFLREMTKFMYVSQDYDEEMKKIDHLTEYLFHEYGDKMVLRDKEAMRATEILFQPNLLKPFLSEQNEDEEESRWMKMYKKRTLDDIPEMGIHEMVFASIMENGSETYRSFMFRNIVLSGGITMLKGFKERLEKELIKLCDGRYEVKIITPENNNNRHRVLEGAKKMVSNENFVEFLAKVKDVKVGKVKFNPFPNKGLLHSVDMKERVEFVKNELKDSSNEEDNIFVVKFGVSGENNVRMFSCFI